MAAYVKIRWIIFLWIIVSFCAFMLVISYIKYQLKYKDTIDVNTLNDFKYLKRTENTNTTFNDFKYLKTTEKPKEIFNDFKYLKTTGKPNITFNDFRNLKTEEKPKPTWTIIVIINNGYLDFFQNWFHYYRKLNLEYEVVAIAEDDLAFSKLQLLTVKLRFTLIKSGRISSSDPADYGSEAFATLTSGRPGYLLKYLLDGQNIVYADVDAVWMKDPFPYFSGDFDMWIQVDAPNVQCTGLMAIKSCTESIKLMEMWIESLRKHVQIDQNAFNGILPLSVIRLNKLDELHFPSGKLYFEAYDNEKRAHAVIVHNNYIIGHTAKLQRFRANNLWFT